MEDVPMRRPSLVHVAGFVLSLVCATAIPTTGLAPVNDCRHAPHRNENPVSGYRGHHAEHFISRTLFATAGLPVETSGVPRSVRC